MVSADTDGQDRRSFLTTVIIVKITQLLVFLRDSKRVEVRVIPQSLNRRSEASDASQMCGLNIAHLKVSANEE